MKRQILFSAILVCYISLSNAQKLQTSYSLYQVINSLAISESNIFAGTQDGGIFLSSNNGITWTPINNGLTNYHINTLAISGGNIFAGTNNGVFISTNNGANWTAVSNGLPIEIDVMSLGISGSNIFAGTWGGGLYSSSNNGTSWTQASIGLTNYYVKVLAVNGSDIYVGTYGGGLFKSTNNGASWSAINTGLANYYIYALTISGSNIFAGTLGDGVFLSTNNGSSWTAVNTGSTNLNIYSLAITGSQIFAGTWGGGVFVSSNNGSSWNAVNTGLTTPYVYSLITSGNNIYLGTWNGGLFLSSNNGSSWTERNNGLTKKISMATATNEMANWDKYPTYEMYSYMMTKFQTDYPNLFKRYNLVTLSSGRNIIAGKISKNVNTKASKPKFLYSSTMHGNEPAGFVIMLRFIDYLLSNYATDPQAASIVDNIELWVLPCTNPDGTYHGGNSTITGAQRFNSNNVDLNRNYPNPAAGANPDGAQYQLETKSLMSFADTMNFVMAANFHSGHEYFCYPWDSWGSSRKHADDDWWRMVGKAFVDTCQKYGSLNSMPSYFKENQSGIIEGGAVNVLYGTRQDYMNYYQHCREVTIEVSYTYLVGSDFLPNYWNSIYHSLLRYPEECLNGIQGVVTDSCTGKPIRAKVFVNNHDVDNSWVYSGSTFGNYYRPIKGGTWSLTYSAPGYKPRTISNITIADGSAVIQNVKLIHSNPDSSFSYAINENTVNFTNTSANGVSYQWNFGDGNTSNVQNPSHTYSSNGTYAVQLTVSNGCGVISCSQQVIGLSVGISNQLIAKRVEMYPNPTNSYFTININVEKTENANISVIDILGNTIYKQSESLYPGSNQLKVDMSKNRQGVYIIQIITPSIKFNYKIIKKD